MNKTIDIEDLYSRAFVGEPYGLDGHLDVEKFVKLIVEECCDIIRETRWAVPPTQEQIAKNLMERLGEE